MKTNKKGRRRLGGKKTTGSSEVIHNNDDVGVEGTHSQNLNIESSLNQLSCFLPLSSVLAALAEKWKHVYQ